MTRVGSQRHSTQKQKNKKQTNKTKQKQQNARFFH
jgi:hypothetical protein